MAKDKFEISIEAKDNTKKGFDSVKKNAQQTQQAVDKAGAGQVGAAAPALSSKSMDKTFSKMETHLKKMAKDIASLARFGIGSPGGGGGPGMPTRPQSGAPQPGGRMGMLGRFGLWGGAAMALGGMAFGLMNRMSGSYQQAAKPQLQALQQIGGMYGTTQGGYFGGNVERGLMPSQEAAFQSAFTREFGIPYTTKDTSKTMLERARNIKFSREKEASVISRTGMSPMGYAASPMLTRDIGKYYEEGRNKEIAKEDIRRGQKIYGLRQQFDTASDVSAAFGIDINRVGELQGKLGRFGRRDANGYTLPGEGPSGGLLNVAGYAQSAGMGGARTIQFFNKFEQVMMNAVSKGMTTPNKELSRTLALTMKYGDERQKERATTLASGFTGMAQQAALLQGGPESSMLFASMLEKTGGDVTKARSMAAGGFNTENLQDYIKFVGKMGGLGAGDMGTLFLQRTLAGGLPTDPEEASKYLQDISTGKVGAGGIQSVINNRLANTTSTTTRASIPDMLKELEGLSSINQSAASAMNDLKKMWASVMTGTSVLPVRIVETVNEEKKKR